MALFKATEEFRKYKAVDLNTNFETLLPYVSNAEEEFMKDLLGDDLYTALEADYQANTDGTGVNVNMDADLLALLPYVQRPLANYAYFLGFNEIAANVGDAGIQVITGQNTQPAPKWLQDKLLSKALRDADLYADKLLAFLETNKATTAYAEWANSPCNTIAAGMIMQSASMASDYIDIKDSRRIFLKMKRFIKAIEDKEIRRLICDDQYDRLVTGIKDDDLTTAENDLIDKLRPVIAKEALWLTMPTLVISIEADGIFAYSFSDSTITKTLATAEQIKNYRIGLREGMYGWENDIEALKQFMKDNISDYPLIEASKCYTLQPDPGPTWKVDNYSDRGHFSV